MAVDWTDPCARANALREAYYALLSGSKTQEISYEDAGQSRTVKFASSKVDMARLRDELRAAEEACGSVTPTQTRRVAMTGGALRKTRAW